ncbi:MAG: hypothetical protein Q9222_004262 [Ikaeria aurantiellina]
MTSSTGKAPVAESSLSTPPPEPSSSSNATSNFDITTTYHSLLASDPLLTAPLAAISALIHLLIHSPPSTISETLSLLSHYSTALKDSTRNPIGLSAGTDLFQRYVIGVLQSPQEGNNQNKNSNEDFKSMRNRLVDNGRLFVENAKKSRDVIAQTARQFVREGNTVLTMGESRVVRAVLNAAADKGVRFRVVYVKNPAAKGTLKDGIVAQLRRKSIPVAMVGPSAVAYSLGKITNIMIGAEGVVENGGAVSRMGTFQIAVLAQSAGKPVYVVAESHKFVRLYPLSQFDLPVRQTVLDFNESSVGNEENEAKDRRKERDTGETEAEDQAVDYTPPELITALVTEAGVQTPSAISEEMIKIWS